MTATAKKTTAKAAEKEPVTSVVTVELVNVEGMLPATVFTGANIEEFISRIKKERGDFLKKNEALYQADAELTKKDEAYLVKFANRFTKTKTLLDDMGKDYVVVLKDEPKRIDGLRKLFRDQMDAWHAEIRKPVTRLEEKNKARKEAHEKHLADIGAQITFPAGQPASAEVQRRIDFVMLFQQRAWEEYDELYQTTYKAVMDSLKITLDASKTAEHNTAELKKLQDKQAKDAEDARVERARLAGIEEGQRLAASAPAAAPAPIVHTAASMPSSNPRIRTAQDEARAAINREVLADLLAYGCKEEGARALIKAIVTGTIRHVTINYGA